MSRGWLAVLAVITIFGILLLVRDCRNAQAQLEDAQDLAESLAHQLRDCEARVDAAQK